MLPLLPPNPPELTIAYRGAQAISRATFLRDVAALAARLPVDRPILNLCQDRYLFAVGLFAAISRHVLSLLPNAMTPETIAQLFRDHSDLLCLCDEAEAPFNLPYLHVEVAVEPASEVLQTPLIAANLQIACVFTSGSTGQAQPYFKRFGTLVDISVAEAERLWSETGVPCAIIGTVPFQHMYGLESTVMLPLLGSGVLTSARPFYPADVAQATAEVPAPRFLVTTPFHLRTLLDAEVEMPALAGILSATAPLPRDLAERAEVALGAPLLEIYGATEVGQVATRRPAKTECWQLFSGFSLSQQDGASWVSGAVLDRSMPLGDVLECLDAEHFHLLGRGADMINIAGKRSSLAFLNSVVLRVPGVRDAAFCLPEEGERGRLAAFVVAPGVTAKVILQGLRAHVDAVFLPRPIVFVEVLPRNETGKLTAAALGALVGQHIKKGNHDS
jgi:acyl-coenzyme A synthetase/AMP-(fatty) acid ligase